jgi:hypothetical protein
MPQVGAPKWGTAGYHNIAGARFAKTHLQLFAFGLIAEAQTGATAVTPGLTGNNVINLMLDKTRQRVTFTFC